MLLSGVPRRAPFRPAPGTRPTDPARLLLRVPVPTQTLRRPGPQNPRPRGSDRRLVPTARAPTPTPPSVRERRAPRRWAVRVRVHVRAGRGRGARRGPSPAAAAAPGPRAPGRGPTRGPWGARRPSAPPARPRAGAPRVGGPAGDRGAPLPSAGGRGPRRPPCARAPRPPEEAAHACDSHRTGSPDLRPSAEGRPRRRLDPAPAGLPPVRGARRRPDAPGRPPR